MDANASKIAVIAIHLLLSLVFPLFADKNPVTLETAESLEKDKKFDQAMVIYEEWLKDHASDPRFPAVLRRCGELKKNPLAVIELYRTHVAALKDPALRSTLYREIALLYALLGDYRNALGHFERAFEKPEAAAPNDPWLAAVPALYVACGETEAAYEWVKRVDPAVTAPELRAELNYALLEIYLARREINFAEKALSLLAAEFKNTPAYPKALLRIGVFYFTQDEKEKAKVYHEALQRDFPSSLENQAAQALWSGRAGSVSLLSDPHDIISGLSFTPDAVKPAADEKPAPAEKPPEPTAVPPNANQEPPRDLRVQVGSYGMRENAVYMVKDLEKLKFAAEIVEIEIKGKKYYRVFVGKGLSTDEAQVLLARLQDSGIGGYLYTGEK